MEKTKCEITIKLDEQAYVNGDFNDTIDEPPPNRNYFEYKGKDYHHFAGAIGWPPDFSSVPGCSIVLGVTRKDIPRFEILDVAFSLTPQQIFHRCCEVRDKFGFRECSALFNSWIGDSIRYSSLEDEFNTENFDLKEDRCGIYVTNPPDLEKPNSDEICVAQLRTVIADKRLVITDQFYVVRDALQFMTPEDTRLKELPAVAALAYAVHELVTLKPWLSVDRSFDLEEEGGGDSFNMD